MSKNRKYKSRDTSRRNYPNRRNCAGHFSTLTTNASSTTGDLGQQNQNTSSTQTKPGDNSQRLQRFEESQDEKKIEAAASLSLDDCGHIAVESKRFRSILQSARKVCQQFFVRFVANLDNVSTETTNAVDLRELLHWPYIVDRVWTVVGHTLQAIMACAFVQVAGKNRSILLKLMMEWYAQSEEKASSLSKLQVDYKDRLIDSKALEDAFYELDYELDEFTLSMCEHEVGTWIWLFWDKTPAQQPQSPMMKKSNVKNNINGVKLTCRPFVIAKTDEAVRAKLVQQRTQILYAFALVLRNWLDTLHNGGLADKDYESYRRSLIYFLTTYCLSDEMLKTLRSHYVALRSHVQRKREQARAAKVERDIVGAVEYEKTAATEKENASSDLHQSATRVSSLTEHDSRSPTTACEQDSRNAITRLVELSADDVVKNLLFMYRELLDMATGKDALNFADVEGLSSVSVRLTDVALSIISTFDFYVI